MPERRDHPRVCGEKIGEKGNVATIPGSPPRMRGKGIGFCVRLMLFGITPACAGKRQER